MSSLDMRNAEDVCKGNSYNEVSSMVGLKPLSTAACLNLDENKAQCARHFLVTKSNA